MRYYPYLVVGPIYEAFQCAKVATYSQGITQCGYFRILSRVIRSTVELSTTYCTRYQLRCFRRFGRYFLGFLPWRMLQCLAQRKLTVQPGILTPAWTLEAGWQAGVALGGHGSGGVTICCQV